MKSTLWLTFAWLVLLQSGCTLGPTIEQQASEEQQQQQTAKRSDAFARDLQQ